jgi:hypothetical protein
MNLLAGAFLEGCSPRAIFQYGGSSSFKRGHLQALPEHHLERKGGRMPGRQKGQLLEYLLPHQMHLCVHPDPSKVGITD